MLSPVRKKVRRNTPKNLIPFDCFQQLCPIIFSFAGLPSICNFHCIQKEVFNLYYVSNNINWELFFIAIADDVYIKKIKNRNNKNKINYLEELKKMYSRQIHDNYDQFSTKVQWLKQRFGYTPPAMKEYTHFKIKNAYFKSPKCLYLETPVVQVLLVKPNNSRFCIGGYYLFVKSEHLKTKLMKMVRQWNYLDSLDRSKVLLQFTNYRQDYWNEKEITVFEFDKYLRGRDTWLQPTTNIYNNIMENVGIGVDYNPHRLWPKHAKITFEVTMHNLNSFHEPIGNVCTHIRIVAREIHFL